MGRVDPKLPPGLETAYVPAPGLLPEAKLYLEDDFVVPSQWVEPCADTAERNLMRAVLVQALHDLKAAPESEEFKDAWAWFFSPAINWLYAFEVICDVLGFSAEAFRGAVKARWQTIALNLGPRTLGNGNHRHVITTSEAPRTRGPRSEWGQRSRGG